METEFGPVGFVRIIKSESSSHDVALLCQIVTTIYPSAKSGNSLSDGFFTDDAFGESEEYTSKRHALVKVPKKTTKKTMVEMNKTRPDACLYRILSHEVEDVLTEEQMHAIDDGTSGKTLEDYLESCLVKDEDGDVILYNNKEQYKSVHYSVDGRDDVDKR